MVKLSKNLRTKLREVIRGRLDANGKALAFKELRAIRPYFEKWLKRDTLEFDIPLEQPRGNKLVDKSTTQLVREPNRIAQPLIQPR